MKFTELKYMKIMGEMLLCFVFFASNACADDTLQIKPEMIAAFKDSKVIVSDGGGKYQIGHVESKWSKVYDIQEKGLSTLDLLAATDSGVFFIGTESHPDTENRSLDGYYYTGLIVLIDSNNKTIREWRSSTDFLHVSKFHNQLTLTSFDGIYTLSPNSDIELIENNDKRMWLTSIRDNQGELILCNSLMESATALFRTGPAGCSKANNWSFDGWWYPPNSTTMTAPISCGTWLVEPVQNKFNSPLSGIIVRDIKSGRLIKKMNLPDFQRFFCVNNSEIMTNASLQSYSFPDIKQGHTYSCNKKEMIISIEKDRDELICLTANGYVGKLKKNK